MRIAWGAVLLGGIASVPVFAQNAAGPAIGPITGEVRSRGVMILRAEPKPAETAPLLPAPAIETAPAPAPSPVAVVEPVPPAPPQPTLAQPTLAQPLAQPLAVHRAAVAIAPLPLQSCARPFAHADVVLQPAALQGGDAVRDFNRALRRKLLARRGPVIVDLVQPFAADKTAPASLVPWLGRIRSSGGAVRNAQYCEQSRGLFSMFRRAFSSDAPGDYAAADTFDAVQHVDGLDQMVTQIEFRPREPPK